MMTDFPIWCRNTDSGELKHFTQPPIPEGWEYAGGHYDFMRGVWVDDEPVPDVEATGDVDTIDVEALPPPVPVKAVKVMARKRKGKK